MVCCYLAHMQAVGWVCPIPCILDLWSYLLPSLAFNLRPLEDLAHSLGFLLFVLVRTLPIHLGLFGCPLDFSSSLLSVGFFFLLEVVLCELGIHEQESGSDVFRRLMRNNGVSLDCLRIQTGTTGLRSHIKRKESQASLSQFLNRNLQKEVPDKELSTRIERLVLEESSHIPAKPTYANADSSESLPTTDPDQSTLPVRFHEGGC